MARTTLAERMTRLEQQRARLAEQQARIKDQERKARTRRLVEAGALIEKAGLLDLEAPALLGALVGLAGAAEKPDAIARWAAEGEKRLAAEAAERDRAREPVIVTLRVAITKEIGAELRGLGLRWNKVMQHWEGLAEWEPVEAVAKRLLGEARRARPEPLAEAAE